jgi:hypothetical protein
LRLLAARLTLSLPSLADWWSGMPGTVKGSPESRYPWSRACWMTGSARVSALGSGLPACLDGMGLIMRL